MSNGTFSIFSFATNSKFTHFHVEFLNYDGEKRKTGDAATCTFD